MRWIADCSCKPIDRLETKGLMDWRGTAIKCSHCGADIRFGSNFIRLGDKYVFCCQSCYVRSRLPESEYLSNEAHWGYVTIEHPLDENSKRTFIRWNPNLVDSHSDEYQSVFSTFYYKQKDEQSQ